MLDTNIILDIALKREPYFKHSAEVFRRIDKNDFVGFITATTVTDIYYISKREIGHDLALSFISDLIEVVEVIGVDKQIIRQAIGFGFRDFEDAIQVSAATAASLDYVITRNTKDFATSEIEALTPSELLKRIK